MTTAKPLSRLTWVTLLALGFVGQLAWAVENQFYNTFLYDRITPDPQAVSWMVSITAVVSTATAILMGTLSDHTRTRWGKRKPFIFIGYIFWGIFTAAFPAAAVFQPIMLGVFMAILIDSIMTFFGATANDAAFNAYIADATTVENRGRVTGALEIMRWIAFLVVYGGAGFIIQFLGYEVFFYVIGGFVVLVGLIFAPRLKEEVDTAKPVTNYWHDIADTFRWSSIRANRNLFLLLICLTVFMAGINVFFPYIMIYLQHNLQLDILPSTIVIAVTILVGGIGLAYPIGLLVDKWGRKPVAIVGVVGEALGLVVFSLARSLPLLVLGGILWIAPMVAWTIASSAWTKDLFPEEKRGQFAGFYILFNVAFTMIPGPLLGGWISSTYGAPIVLDGKPGMVPPALIFQVAAVVVLLTLIPLLLIRDRRAPNVLAVPEGTPGKDLK